jgi:hypothetical protein
MDGAISMLKPGVSTDQVAKDVPEVEGDRASRPRWRPSASTSATASGSGLHERPLISRLNSFIEPYELKAGWSSPSRRSAREGRCVGGADRRGSRAHPEGAKIISLYPHRSFRCQPVLDQGRWPPKAIGWIGAGRMGYVIGGAKPCERRRRCSRLNRTRAKAEPLEKYGAKVAKDNRELSPRRDIRLCMV